MGVSVWYCPEDNDRAVKIDLGANVTELIDEPDVESLDAEAINGQISRAIFRSRLRVTIRLERFTSTTLERDLLTMQTHLDRGGSIAFALNESKAWAGYTNDKRPARTTALHTKGNTWSFGQSATLAAGDVVCVWGGSPEGKREYDTVASFSSPTVTLTNGLRYSYGQGPLLVRHRDFHPCLVRPPNDRSPIITTEGRRVYNLELNLVEDVSMLAAAAGWSPGVLPTTSGSSRGTPPELLASRPLLANAGTNSSGKP